MGSTANGILAVQSAHEDALARNYNPGKVNATEAQMLSDYRKYAPSALPMNGLNYPNWAAGKVFSEGRRGSREPARIGHEREHCQGGGHLHPDAGVFPSTSFAKPGPVPGEPRVHGTTVNYLEVTNGVLKALDTGNHSVGPALSKYPNG